MEDDGLRRDPDEKPRCFWHGGIPEYIRYHDEEWGRPDGDGRALYEKLCLEGFQAGLSWITILRKRAAFRELFEGFEIERVAAMGEADVERIVLDARIVRHRAKILSTINNAKAVRALEQKQGRSFAAFLWSFEPPPEDRPATMTLEWMRANPAPPAAARLSKALKSHGFSFVGATTLYAFMQSMGFVNDHLEGCVCRQACEDERRDFQRPR